MKLERSFYTRDALTVSKELVGKILVHETADGITKARIVETEAYKGDIDKAAHSYGRKRTGRTEIQFGPGGYAYIYLIYGMHFCMNVVAGETGSPEAVLLRALEPLEGLGLMGERRKTGRKGSLCDGPGKLCRAMGIDKSCYGLDLCGNRLYVEDDGWEPGIGQVIATKRINIGYAEEAVDFPWRFILADSPYISKKETGDSRKKRLPGL